MAMISAVYLILLLFTTIVLVLKTRSARDSNFKNIFWALSAFIAMKTCASPLVRSGLNELPEAVSIFGESFVIMASVVSNIFLFHFGISLLTYKSNFKVDYRIFPVVLFTGYMILYASGIVETENLDRTSKFSFAYNGAILSCVGCLNLYYEKRKVLSLKIKYGLILLGTGFLLYALTEGIFSSFLGAQALEILKVISAGSFAISSLTIRDLLNEQKAKNIGFL